MTYDLIVLGGGPAGYLASERAAQKGRKVLLVEKQFYGGVCLNEGCIPTKTYLYAAKLKDGAMHGTGYGVCLSGELSLDHRKVYERKNAVVKQLTTGVQAALKGLGVEMINTRGKIIGKSERGYLVEADGVCYAGYNLLIATGSNALIPPISGVREQYEAGMVLTNREILQMTDVPEKLVIIGGGVIGMEMASYFNSAGAAVTVIEMLDQVGGAIDCDMARILKRNYQKKGIDFKMGCRVTKVEDGKVCYEKDGVQDYVAADKVLLSIGRRAATADLGLEIIDVDTRKGMIITDEHMRTNQPNIYAAGDVNGCSMLAHTAYMEAEVAVNNMFGDTEDTMAYNAIPGIIYTNPEVAGVGETEQSAKEKGLDVTIKKLPMQYSGRYVAENSSGDGIIKLLVENSSKRLVGLHLCANYASEIIVSASMMIAKKMTVEDIKKIVFPHPTVCEVIRDAVHQF